MFRCFLKMSANLGNSIIDWIRSIYFSLFGSSALAFSLKATTLEAETVLFYALAIICFSVGLFFSVRITARFKNFEKRFDREDPKNVEDISKFYIIQDESHANEHFLLYFLFIPAFLFILKAGNNIEIKAGVNSANVNSSLTELSKQNQNLTLKIDSANINSSLTELSKQNQYLTLKINLLEEKINNLLTKKQEFTRVKNKVNPIKKK